MAVQPNDSFVSLGMNNMPPWGWRRQIPPKAVNIYQTTPIIHPALRSKEQQTSHCVRMDDFLNSVRFFYRCPEHLGCHGMSRPKQALHAENLPCSVRILKVYAVYTNTYVHTHTQIGSNFLYWYQLDTQFLYKLHKIKFLYMFRASSAHLQEVNDVNCTCMQPLVFSFSAGGRLMHLLRGVSP